MHKWLYKLFAALCLPVLLCCNMEKQKVNSTVKNEEGLRYMNSGHYEKAIDAFRQAITDPEITNTSKGTIYRNISLTYNEMDEMDSVIHYSTLAAKCFPKYSIDFLVNMSDVDLAAGKIDKGLSRLLKAELIAPDEMLVNNALGLIYMGEYDDDHTDLEKALTYNKKAFEASRDRATEDVLGRNYYYLEDYDNAEYHYDRLMENYPSFVIYPYYAGMIKYKLKKTKEAEALFNKVIAMDSSYRSYVASFKEKN